MRKRKFPLMLLIAAVLTLVLSPVQADAGEKAPAVPDLTLQEATEKALEYTHQLAELDRSIDVMWEQYEELIDASNKIQQQLDAAISRGQLSPEDKFNKYIRNRDFPYYSMAASISNTKVARELAKASISVNIRVLYENILSLYETLEIQEELFGVMQEQNDRLAAKYLEGGVTEYEKYLSGLGLQQKRLEIAKLKRTIDNAEMALKRQIGIPLKQDIVLNPYSVPAVILKDPLPYGQYLEKALSNRAEVVTARMDFKVRQREMDIMKEYITDENLPQRQEAQIALDEKIIALNEAVDAVTKDIYSGYIDVMAKQREVLLSRSREENAERQYLLKKEQYEQGTAAVSDLWNAVAAYTQARIAHKKAIRDYNLALYKLEMASGVGPGYTSGTGGR